MRSVRPMGFGRRGERVAKTPYLLDKVVKKTLDPDGEYAAKIHRWPPLTRANAKQPAAYYIKIEHLLEELIAPIGALCCMCQ